MLFKTVIFCETMGKTKKIGEGSKPMDGVVEPSFPGGVTAGGGKRIIQLSLPLNTYKLKHPLFAFCDKWGMFFCVLEVRFGVSLKLPRTNFVYYERLISPMFSMGSSAFAR